MASQQTAVDRLGAALKAATSDLGVDVKFRPGPGTEITLPHIVYDTKRSQSTYAGNKPYVPILTFKVIYETKHADDEGFHRLLRMETSKLIDATQLPGYNRYTFEMQAI